MIEQYSDSKVGILSENAHLKNQVMNNLIRLGYRTASVPVYKNGVIIRTQTMNVNIGEEFGAQSLVDEDILIQRQIKSGFDFQSIPYKGGYILDFGSTKYITRAAKPKEFHSINAYLSRNGNVIHNNTFIQQVFYKDWLTTNQLNEWRMPFSPDSPSTFAVSWQMIDANGGKWECVSPDLQRPTYVPRLKHFLLNDSKSEYVNIAMGTSPSYDETTHTFYIQDGCRIRMFFINSPLGQKEWSDEVEFNLTTNQIKYI